MATWFWDSGTPQFIVPMVPYYPKLIAVCDDSFDPSSCSISGSSLMVVISQEAIRNMMCCPIFEGTKVFSKTAMEESWGTRRDALSFCQRTLNRSLSARLPKFPLSHSDLKHKDLKDISSTLAWLCGYDNERYVTTAIMGFLFKCRKQRDSYHFDFFVCIARAMVKQLSEF